MKFRILSRTNAVPIVVTLLLVLTATVTVGGCADRTTSPVEPPEPELKTATCVGCHTDYATLKQVASPDTAVSGGGCGGDTPHIEPYDRVFMSGAGFARFKNSTHGKQACTTCHGGVDSTDSKSLAHSNNFVKHPSTQSEQFCASCHYYETANFANSLHAQGWGQKSMVTTRAGYASYDQLPAHLQEGYDHNCAKCHATCGDCHVNRPQAGGGGLYKGHDFQRVPDMTDNCVACHTSRGGHAYFGIGVGTVPDVHLTKLGSGHCINCHSGAELHGNGKAYDQRYQMPALPECSDCHKNLASNNIYHSTHLATFNCQTCHSQDYNNCGSCHIGGEGARVPSYQGFKIALNPIPETKPYKYATVRQSLSAPDSWKEYDMPQLAHFDSRPTYKYTTPHNTIRWTTRTKVAAGNACYDNCHIIQENGVYRNKGLYLYNGDLQNWEQNANKNIVVDGKLPAGWGTP
ncbi:MAG TPA: hypothetical protein VII11_00255 [Bacteroidota bacterium]